MSQAMKKVTLLYNPKAGPSHSSAAGIPQVVAALRARGMLVESQMTSGPGDATRLASLAVADNCEMLVVCGGDGTINEAVQPLIGSKTVLAVWPCGTANVLAKDLHLPRRPETWADLVLSGHVRNISVGRARKPPKPPKPDDGWQRFFLSMAGIGLDAAMVRRVDENLKRHVGIVAYMTAGLGFLVDWRLTPFTLDINGDSHPATFAVIANTSAYGGGFTLAPRARLEENQLDVCIFASRSRIEYLSYALLSLVGGHTHCAHVTYRKAQTVAAQSDREVFVQLDGELAGCLPMRFETVACALRVVGLQ